MKLIPMGEYYVWHCDRCDSTNQIHWSLLSRLELSCGACHLPARCTNPAEEQLQAA